MTIVSIHRRDASRSKGRAGDPGEIKRNPRIGDDKDISPILDNHARFTELVLPHLGDAYALARWITGSRADAEDVVQDACLRAFRAIGKFAGGNARPWVLTIVRNTAYTWLRKNRPSPVLVVEDLEGVEATQTNTSDPDRETLILRDVQGLSYREIAEVTGVPIGTVMSRLARGRHQVIKTIGRSAS
jgi:DNA-directed RNA polymerase specialized sigma24 family protein